MRMPSLDARRLRIRPFTMDDLDAACAILDGTPAADDASGGAAARERRARWLRWTVMNYEELAQLYQPPYGERAMVLTETGRVVGACGFVPCLDAFGQLPALGSDSGDGTRLTSTEFGLFWAVDPAYRGQGYATEAARAIIDYAFTSLRLYRIVATTTYANTASIGVMRRLGMRIERNPYPDPPWLQVVGVLHNARVGAGGTTA